MLPEQDRQKLTEKGYEFEEIADGGFLCVVIKDFRLPPGYDRDSTDVLLRLPSGFPDSQPDMFWCDPPISYANGGVPQASESRETYLGRTWQRFSRHLAPGVWRPGVDSLMTYLSLITRDLARCGR